MSKQPIDYDELSMEIKRKLGFKSIVNGYHFLAVLGIKSRVYDGRKVAVIPQPNGTAIGITSMDQVVEKLQDVAKTLEQ